MPSTRRLAAILAADAVGYSRLMRADEEGTHERFKAHRRELVDPKIRQHHGRIVKYTGDGMLVEFPSVVEAVLCAVEVQSGMSRRNLEVATDERISFRIGINLGDVIAEPEDIYGDGVNIAARLEALAEPDGICISDSVHEQVRDKLPYPFEDLGHVNVKNITRPLHAFLLRPEIIAALAVNAAATAEPEAESFVVPLLQGRAPRLSIVVLPFANLSNNPEQQYFADAITEDVTTDLSRIADMVVISRNTAFIYRDKPVDTKRIGRELNVRYVLQGSVRQSGSRLRVNTQLIDAETDGHLWAERFDYTTDDLFALLDEVTSRIAVALNLELVDAEAARPTEDPDAFDYILRGRAALAKGPTAENFSEAIELFERALALDSASFHAKALLANTLASRALDQLTDSVAGDLDRAERLLAEALPASPRFPLAHFAKGQVFRAQNRHDAAILEYEAALALDRNLVLALAGLSQCRYRAGSLDEALAAQEQAIRLSPRDPYIANRHWSMGMIRLLQARTEEALLWLERARSANPRLPGPHAWLASAYALTGDGESACAELAEARRLSSDDRYSTIARYKSLRLLGSVRGEELAETTFFAGLRKAGVPNE
jgi:TolB-like protein/class 3 adenylate cyclase/Tfp pilus assembly protein PilF